MSIDETAIYVNKRLKEGYSIAKTERELNYGKDTLRKKLNRSNYFFHKDNKSSSVILPSQDPRGY